MAYLLGTDEAGYGPNLGPLVVSATLWHVPDEICRHELYDVLAGAVTLASEEDESPPRVAIADSKHLYQSGQGLGPLEQNLLSALGAAGHHVSCWRDVWRTLAPDSTAELQQLPWYCQFDAPVPVDGDRRRVVQAVARLKTELSTARIECVAIRSVALFARGFNGLVAQHGNKASVLSQVTLRLVRDLLATLDDQPIIIRCDKHGGRNKYGPLLQQLFPEYLVEVYGEGRSLSLYRWGPQKRRVEIGFVAGGERFLPAALASMASKYLRELAMMAFNDFWQQHVPGIRPTAGYPTDAVRFRAEIRPAQVGLRIEDEMLWRKR